jgi:hypothetical protein
LGIGSNTLLVSLAVDITLIGKKVRIRAIKQHGSARLLDGLTGTVVAAHPEVPDWVKVHLDPNVVTPYREWSIPEDRLIVCETESLEPALVGREAEVGHRFRLNSGILAAHSVNGQLTPIRVPSGAVVTIEAGAPGGTEITKATWEGKKLLIFTINLREHGTMID